MNIASFLSPKEEVTFLRDDMTIRQGLEKMKRYGYTAVPVIDAEDRYVGVVSEGDFLWNILSHNSELDSITMKSLEKLSIRDIIQNGKIRPVCIDTNMEELLGQAQMQNFVPVIDDRNVFIGIITRSEIIKGIIFRDVTSVLQDADGLHLAIDTMQEKIKDLDYDVVVGPESRGFIFGTPIAYNNHKPFVLIRKKGKLPRETVSATYDLEYGSATIEMHKDSIKPGQKVLIVDDLIATGGTTEAMIKLIESLGGEVAGVVVLIELAGLKGRERINKYRLESAICYEGK